MIIGFKTDDFRLHGRKSILRQIHPLRYCEGADHHNPKEAHTMTKRNERRRRERDEWDAGANIATPIRVVWFNGVAHILGSLKGEEYPREFRDLLR